MSTDHRYNPYLLSKVSNTIFISLTRFISFALAKCILNTWHSFSVQQFCKILSLSLSLSHFPPFSWELSLYHHHHILFSLIVPMLFCNDLQFLAYKKWLVTYLICHVGSCMIHCYCYSQNIIVLPVWYMFHTETIFLFLLPDALHALNPFLIHTYFLILQIYQNPSTTET